MLIKETIERECCEPKDRAYFNGGVIHGTDYNTRFCVHCGQIWINDKEVRDGNNEVHYEWRKAEPPR